MKYAATAILAAAILFVALFVRTEKGLGLDRVTYTMYKYELYDIFRRKAGQDFQEKWNKEHPDHRIEVSYDPIGGDYPAKVNAEVVAGTVQDVFFVPDASQFAHKGILLDLMPYVEKYKAQPYLDAIYPDLIKYHMIDGHLYGLPNNLNTTVLFYNRTIFDREKIPYPTADWTWQTMLEVAQKLTKRDAKGRLVQSGLTPNAIPYWIIWNGGRFWNEAGTKCIVDSPEAREGLQFLHDLQFKYRVCPTPSEMRDVSGNVNFENNATAMLLGIRWWTAVFKNLSNVNWAVAPLPKSFKGRRPAFLGFNTLGINAKTKYPDLAFQFLLHLTGPDQIRHLIDVGDSIPIHRTPGETEYFLNEKGRPKGENSAYLIGMDDPVCYDTNFYSPYLPVAEAELEMLGIQEEFLRQDTDIPKLLKELQDKLNERYQERVAPPEKPRMGEFAVFVAAAMSIAGGLIFWRVRSAKRAFE